MSHSARDLYPSWYSEALKKDISTEELSLRRITIDALLANDDHLIWIKALKVYLGLLSEDNNEYLEVLELFKKEDDMFMVKNVFLLQLLCGFAIAEQIEKNNNHISDVLALGILTTHYLVSTTAIGDLKQIASNFWINECESVKSLSFNDELGKIEQTTPKVAIAAITGTDYADIEPVKALGVKAVAGMTGIIKDLSALIGNFKNLQNEYSKNIKTLSEETNILWWIFGGHSALVEKPFSKISGPLLSIVIPLELGNLIEAPGVGKINNLILKCLDNKDGLKESYSLNEIINSCSEEPEKLQKAIPEIPENIILLCPFLHALKTFNEYTGEEWKAVYAKKVKLNLDAELPLVTFSNQLFKELMLIDSYKKLADD